MTEFQLFLEMARGASLINKLDFVRGHVAGKDVLDLGCVGHSLSRCLQAPDRWLHNIIRKHARSVLGVDLLEKQVAELQRMGYEVICADALTLRLDRKFGVVVCGDLVEHVTSLEALLETITYHLYDDGIALITTPNPFAITRFFNILADGWTDINTEHVCWICPQTMFQLVERSGLFIDDFCWLETDFPMPTKRRFWGWLLNFIAPLIASKRQVLHNDYGVVLQKKPLLCKDPACDRPLISVILPTYNRSKYLEGAVRSLLTQDYPPELFEIIVVDNASTDDTAQRMYWLAQETSRKINLKYVREERRGLVFTRHTGAAHAEGDILLFGDDDAIFDKNWLSTISNVYAQYPEVGAVGTKIAIQWEGNPEAWVSRYEGVLGKLDYGDQTLVRHGLYINGGSFSIRKEILLRVNGFNPGQRGEYIVGDSETGLCRKLANARVLVGWTPDATVWHLQQAEVNGNLHDLKRRFRNNGICGAYYAAFYGWKRRQILVDIWRKTYRVVRKILGPILHRDLERLHYDVPLEIAYYFYYLKYLWLYHFSRTIRREIMERDWEFSCNYEAPPVEFIIHRNKANLENGLNKVCHRTVD